MFENIKAKAAAAFAAVGGGAMLLPAVALADETPSMSTIKTTVGTALQGVQADAISLIQTVLPYALGVMAVSLVVTIGIRIFSKFAKRG